MTTTPEYVSGLELGPQMREEALDLVDRLVRLYRDKATDQADGQWHEPVDSYRDPDLWRREVEAVHRRVPLPLAMSCEVSKPGSYKSISVAGIPIIITRDLAGTVHASFNACRHRGSELVPEGYGELKRLTCPYHAWSYDLAGCLVGVYGEKTFGPLDRETRGLVSLPVEERAGFVFVSLTPGADLDLDGWLGGITPFLESLELDRGHHYSTRELEGPNWKIVIDGYLEGYHFASLHRETVFKTNLSNLTAFDTWGPHQRGAHALRPIAEAATQTRDEWEPANCVGAIYWLFPGLAISGGWRSHTAVSLVLPGATWDTSRTQQIVVLRHTPVDDEEIKAADHTRDWFHDVVLDEDYATGYGVQRGLAALSGTDFVFGRNEPGVQHFHRVLKEMVR
jgi:phenylpropionate dioxygenase-like ring-hydroxylating dioxygenase large terminal subunit